MKFHTVSFEDWTKSDSFRETQQTKQLNTEANNSAFKLLQPVLKITSGLHSPFNATIPRYTAKRDLRYSSKMLP